MKVKKYEQGSIFSVYTPVTQNNKSSSSDFLIKYLQSELISGKAAEAKAATKESSKSGYDTTELLKSLKGLDNDVNYAAQVLKKQAIEESIIGTSISGHIDNYFKNIQLINTIDNSKKAYDKAEQHAKTNKSLNEFAVTANGGVAVLDGDTLNVITPEEYFRNKNKYKIQTNSSLLFMRRHDANTIFKDSILSIVESGTSMQNIVAYINNIISGLGSNDDSVSGYTSKENSQIKSGVSILKDVGEGMLVDGIYKVKLQSKDQAKLATIAIQAIYTSLNANEKALLKLKSNGTEAGAKGLITAIVMGKLDTSKDYSVDYQDKMSENVLGTENKSSKSGSEPELEKQVKLDPVSQFFLGYGNKQKLTIQNKGQVAYKVDVNNMPLGITLGSLNQALKDFGNILNTGSMTMGGQRLDPTALDLVIVNGGQIYGAELPVIRESQNRIRPNYELLKQVEEADKELKRKGIIMQGKIDPSQVNIINSVYDKHHLPIKYNTDGSLRSKYARFAMLQIQGLGDAFSSTDFDGTVEEVTDKREKVLFEQNMKKYSGDEKFELQNSFLGLGKDDHIYEGVLFIPVYNNIWNALASSNSAISPTVSQEIEEKQKETDNIINSGYVKPESWNNK